MSDLRSFIALQARLYEFLEQQDEATLLAIVSGTARLAVLHSDETGTPVPPLRSDARVPSELTSTDAPTEPASDPVQAALGLAKLTTEHERRIYLADLKVKDLAKVAKLCGFTAYSALRKHELLALLVGGGQDQTDRPKSEPRAQASPSPAPPNGGSIVEQQETAPAVEIAKPDVDAATIASRLRETETEDEGAEFLRAQHLDRESLLAVAAELQLTRVDRLSQRDLEKRVLKQAIGARRKFAGLRKW